MDVDDVARRQRTRARASVLIAVAGLLDLVSALTPSLRPRLRELLSLLPLEIPQTAAAATALAGLLLLVLAQGVRRGGRRPWLAATILVAATTVFHLLKGVDAEEALAAVGLTAYLLRHKDAFRARSDDRGVRDAAVLLATGVLAASATAVIAIELFDRHGGRLPVPTALVAVLARLVGVSAVPLPDHLDDFLTPVLATVGTAVFVIAAWLAFRPVVTRRRHDRTALERARSIVSRYGTDTLSWFALRDDKQFFFHKSSVVAYGVFGGVCLVSPDPVGPPEDRAETWAAFRHFADEQGWALAVLGASQDWLPVYRASGMREIYIGDEAVVDCTRFSLEGGRFKALRQAVNRVARYGYRAEFFDPATLDPQLASQLRALASSARRGGVERGFSMTLGRLFDPADTGLLLVVVFAADGRPVAFCQYVPAPGIEGWSLDVMRRDRGEHPNGLLDFAVVETIRWIRDHGGRGLALNFATMRAVLAGETDGTVATRAQRWLLRRLSESMQIESLWRYNAKFDPDWRPRYALYDARDRIVPAALAVARAESFWELPLVGRFFRPTPPQPPPAAAAEGLVPSREVQPPSRLPLPGSTR